MREFDLDSITLDDLSEVVLHADVTWTLIGRDVKEQFRPDDPLTLGELLGVIGRTYARLAEERPRIDWHDEELDDGSAPFWGDHNFVEGITIGETARTVTLSLGS